MQILNSLLKFETLDLNMGDICGRMDGYSLADINVFYECVVKEMTIRHIKYRSPKKLLLSDFDETFKTFKPLSISNANVETSKVEWNSIGG